jgi:hypothetical protein
MQGLNEMFPICELAPTALPKRLIRCRPVSEMEDARRMAKGKKVTCEDCFFRRNLLCALRQDEPCPTFRPNTPEGLRPPSQMRFVFREQRRTMSTFVFPTADEQAALHA